MDRKELSEADVRDQFITPAIKNAGWDQTKPIGREVTLAPRPVIVRGTLSSRNKRKKKSADYLLSWEAEVSVAIVSSAA